MFFWCIFQINIFARLNCIWGSREPSVFTQGPGNAKALPKSISARSNCGKRLSPTESEQCWQCQIANAWGENRENSRFLEHFVWSRGQLPGQNWQIELQTWMTEILRIQCLHCKRNLNILTKHFNLKYSQDYDVFYWHFGWFVPGQWILIWSLPRRCPLRRFVLDKVIVTLLRHAAQQFHGL